MPDSSIMLDLCRALKISVTDLFSGEVVTVENYNEQLEQSMIEMVKEREQSDKRMLSFEIVIGVLSMIILFGFVLAAAFVPMVDWLRICLIVVGLVIAMVGILFAVRIEQVAGYYECGKCGHKYVPTYCSVLWAMHVNRTRYMKCPKCNEKSWNKKVLSKK